MYSHPTHELIQDQATVFPRLSLDLYMCGLLKLNIVWMWKDVLLPCSLARLAEKPKLLGEEIEMSVLTDARWAAGQVHDGRWGTRGNYP